MYVMRRRTTVFLEDELLERAQRYAARHGKSFAQLVREAVLAYIAGGGTMKRKLPRLAGEFATGETNVSERVDELLWKDPHS